MKKKFMTKQVLYYMLDCWKQIHTKLSSYCCKCNKLSFPFISVVYGLWNILKDILSPVKLQNIPEEKYLFKGVMTKQTLGRHERIHGRGTSAPPYRGACGGPRAGEGEVTPELWTAYQGTWWNTAWGCGGGGGVWLFSASVCVCVGL